MNNISQQGMFCQEFGRLEHLERLKEGGKEEEEEGEEEEEEEEGEECQELGDKR